MPASYWENQFTNAENIDARRHNFVTIEEGAIYSSANPDGDFTRWLITQKHVRTFVSLRGDFTPEQQREIEGAGGSMHVFRWTAKRIPPENEIAQVLSLLSNGTTAPVHVFCRAGADRTGFIRAYWRLQRQGWTKKQAFQEMKLHLHIIPDHFEEYLEKKFPDK